MRRQVASATEYRMIFLLGDSGGALASGDASTGRVQPGGDDRHAAERGAISPLKKSDLLRTGRFRPDRTSQSSLSSSRIIHEPPTASTQMTSLDCVRATIPILEGDHRAR